jgi:hypothetical protein
MATSQLSDVIIMPWRTRAFVGDYYERLLTDTLAHSPCVGKLVHVIRVYNPNVSPVALLATHTPDDVDEDALRPINALVIRTVLIVLVGADADGHALNFVSHYSGHKHVQTEVLVVVPADSFPLDVQVWYECLYERCKIFGAFIHKSYTG